jgi:hypothetical protein
MRLAPKAGGFVITFEGNVIQTMALFFEIA